MVNGKRLSSVSTRLERTHEDLECSALQEESSRSRKLSCSALCAAKWSIPEDSHKLANLLLKRRVCRVLPIRFVEGGDSHSVPNMLLKRRDRGVIVAPEAEEKARSSARTNTGFGVSSRRFNYLGIHPTLVTKDMVDKNVKIGPNTYKIKKNECGYKKHGGPYDWRRKLDTEDWSRNLGYICPGVMLFRQILNDHLGPACYDLVEPKHVSRKVNGLFGTAKRFKVAKPEAPPPGTYTKGLLKNPRKSTPVPTFEWDCRDRFGEMGKPFHLPPNRYNVEIRGTISERVNKIVSHKRNPLNFLTGPRDDTTIKNHFTPAKSSAPERYFVPRNDLDELLHSKDLAFYGRFSKAKRFCEKTVVRVMMDNVNTCYRDPKFPGPNHYNVDPPKKFATLLHPFNQSTSNTTPLQWNISPGPGRYGKSIIKKYPRRQMSSVFASTSERFPPLKTDYSGFG